MRLVEQFLQFTQQGVAIVLKYVKMIWGWSVTQIEDLPWENMRELPIWKMAVLVVVAGGIIYLLYASVKELIEAGQKALAAFVTLLSVLVKTLVPLLMAGLVAAGGAWIINNVQF